MDPAWEMPEFAATTPCRISGCWNTVSDGDACHEHGGHPYIEADTDCFGYTTWRIDKEGHSDATTS